jgi:predicted AlkP superfamily phosphohydrolase/phosphomutase
MMENRTIWLGLDGGTFSILDPLMEEGVMPFLKQFIASGTRGRLVSVIPPITQPAWTSMMTGRSPGNHGIFDFFRFESPNSRYVRFLNSRNIACETIWSILNRQGLKATSLNFPVMTPIRPINGFIVPGWVPERHIRRSCYPRNLYDRLNEIDGVDVKEMAMDPVADRMALTGLPQEDYHGWIEEHARKEEQWFKSLRYLMKEEPCHLTAILFDGMDKLQHLCWRFISPEHFPKKPSSWEQEIRNICLDYYRILDKFIAEIVALAGPETSVFMASDHGFSTSVEIFYLNTWLQQNGYLKWAKDVEVASADNIDSQDPRIVLPRNYINTLDWSQTTAHGLTASSNAIHISVAGQRGEEGGIPPEDYERFRQELINALLQFAPDETGKPVVTKAWKREEIFAGSQMYLAPDLTLSLRDDGFISTLRSDVVFMKRPEPVGTHHPDGIFIAGGPGIRKGFSLDELSILDVTPTLLYSMGLPIPEDLEGRMPAEIFETDFIQTHPVYIGEATLPPEEFPQDVTDEMDAKGKAAILRRLKALGYVD